MNKKKQHLASQIDDLLPQTQCQLCDYEGCKPYAEAIANGHESIDRCLPGGIKTLKKLAQLLNIDSKPFLKEMEKKAKPPMLAYIREAECIGCTKCIQACPTDAIIGASKQMHTVITDACTGCELCLAPCPVDCIDMQVIEERSDAEQRLFSEKSKARYEKRKIRLSKENQKKRAHYLEAKFAKSQTNSLEARQEEIAKAVARSKAKKQGNDS